MRKVAPHLAESAEFVGRLAAAHARIVDEWTLCQAEAQGPLLHRAWPVREAGEEEVSDATT